MRFLNEQLNESINDKGILKAVFFIGLPGAGKTSMIKDLHDGAIPLMILNSDKWTKWYDDNYGRKEWRDIGRIVKKRTTSNVVSHVNGLLPIYVDTTVAKPRQFAARVKFLEEFGYDTKLFHVDVKLETALKRNKERAEKGEQYLVDPQHIIKTYSVLNKDLSSFKSIVPDYKRVMNNDFEFTKEIGMKLFNEMNRFFKSPVKNPVGKELLDFMRKMGYKYYSDISDEERIENGFVRLDKSLKWY